MGFMPITVWEFTRRFPNCRRTALAGWLIEVRNPEAGVTGSEVWLSPGWRLYRLFIAHVWGWRKRSPDRKLHLQMRPLLGDWILGARLWIHDRTVTAQVPKRNNWRA